MKLLIIILSLFLTSCASLSEKAQSLHIASSLEEVKNCEKIGKVASSSGISNDGGMVMLGNHNSDIKLKNMAAEIGDTIYYLKNDASLFGSERVGIVFNCRYRGLSNSNLK